MGGYRRRGSDRSDVKEREIFGLGLNGSLSALFHLDAGFGDGAKQARGKETGGRLELARSEVGSCSTGD